MKPYVKIVAIAKNEAAYIPQWIAHHLYFGFDEIEIWVNGTTDNSLEILAKISSVYPNIKFKNADSILEDVLKNGKNFQIEAYQLMLNEAVDQGKSTHLLFLDIDEYWTPKDFQTNIKRAIETTRGDAISYQWHLDIPDHARAEFLRPFHAVNRLEKNPHVKTLIKLGRNDIKANIHNSVILDGDYRLFDGSVFEEVDRYQHGRALVSAQYFNQTRSTLDDFFVYHQIHRSLKEYLAALSRGRHHAGDNEPIKTNRHGYIPLSPGVSALIFALDAMELSKYEVFFDSFISQANISKELIAAREFHIQKYNSIIEMISIIPDFTQKYAKQFRGTGLGVENSFAEPSIKNCVDKVIVNADDNTIVVVGWAFETSTSTLPTISQNAPNAVFSIDEVERPDVKRIYPNAPLSSGFRLVLRFSKADDIVTLGNNLTIEFSSVVVKSSPRRMTVTLNKKP